MTALSFLRRWMPGAAALLAVTACDRHSAPTAPEAASPDAPSLAVAGSSRTSLGTLGGTSSTAYDINVHGQVVGTSTLADGSSRAFLWQAGTGMTALPAGTTHAYGINDAGQVVGRGVFGGYARGFVWNPSTSTLKQLPLGVGSSTTGEARDINNAGQVVGFSNVGATPRAILWTPDASQASGYRVTVIGTGRSQAHGINNHGTVVGWFTNSSGLSYAFRWNPTAANAPTGTLQTLPNWGSTYDIGGAAYDINAAGQIAGYAIRNGLRKAVVWDVGAAAPRGWSLPRDGFGSDKASEAFGIDEAGDAAGIYDGRAWFFPEGSDMQPLSAPTTPASAAYGMGGGRVVGQAAGTAALWSDIVTNRAPVAVTGGPYVVAPGDTVVLDASGSTDPDGDPLTYLWINGNDTTYSPTYAFSRPNRGRYSMSLIVRDDDGRADSVLYMTVTVNNLPTAVIANGPAVSGNEGSPIYLDGTPSGDADAGDSITFAWTFGDGTTSAGDDLNKTYADNGAYSVRLIVTDELGGRDTAFAIATVANVAPTAVFDQTPGREGTARPLSLSGVVEPSITDRASLQYAFDCGAGYGAWGSAASVSCPAVPDQDTVPVRAKVRDKDGGESEYARNQNVANVLPLVSASPSSREVEVGELVTVVGSFTDPGADAPWTWTYDWGDGTSSRGGTSGFTLPPNGHRYTSPGTYTLRVSVRDDRGYGYATAVPIDVGIVTIPP